MKHTNQSASPCDLERQHFRDRLHRQAKRTGLKYPDEFCHSSAASFSNLDSESALFVYSVYSVVRKALRFDIRFRRDFPKRNLFLRLNSQIQIQPQTPPEKKRRNVSTDLAGTCLAHILARFLARNGTQKAQQNTLWHTKTHAFFKNNVPVRSPLKHFSSDRSSANPGRPARVEEKAGISRLISTKNPRKAALATKNYFQVANPPPFTVQISKKHSEHSQNTVQTQWKHNEKHDGNTVKLQQNTQKHTKHALFFNGGGLGAQGEAEPLACPVPPDFVAGKLPPQDAIVLAFAGPGAVKSGMLRLSRKLFFSGVATVSVFLCGLRALHAEVPAQPLAANAKRLLEALDHFGHPLSESTTRSLNEAIRSRDALAIQKLLDPNVLFLVDINPELRVKVARGEAPVILQQGGFTPTLVKIRNYAAATQRLNIDSPQAGPVYAGAAQGILERQQQTELKINENKNNDPDRFLDVQIFSSPPMTERLSGLEIEYAIALIYSNESGQREGTISFNIGQGTQDIGFRAELPVLFTIRPAIPVKLSIRDYDGQPTVASLTFRDRDGHTFPPQAKRLAPDLFFEPQIYRPDNGIVLLPPGEFELTCTRGPEYRELKKHVTVPSQGPAQIEVKLDRWINPTAFGFYNGDHHIHAAGCSHYEIPTQGIEPADMFLQVKGEGLNVGCVLTWGPCYDFQRRFFAPVSADISEPFTLLKYDIEVSGFGSQALGHVCLLNLKNQTYPGSDGTKIKGWPTWTVPVLRWTKEQGGVTGYPHSDLYVDPPGCAKYILKRYDKNADSSLDPAEAASALLPKPFNQIDLDGDHRLSLSELSKIADQAGNELPNLVLPSMRGAGAMEIFVSTPEGVCDFISTMNTGRIGEWNTWYHLMNCGFPLKISGETDFPCMSSRRVGQGRVYVNLGTQAVTKLDFTEWCNALGRGRSYVSDGFAHALQFTVNGVAPGFEDVKLSDPGKVQIRAKVAFAAEEPRAVAYGTLDPVEGRRHVGDTVLLHAPRTDETVRGGERLVEIVLNGQPVVHQKVPADGNIHDLAFEIEVKRSSWIALREFPQLHTNPVNILINEKPIRASRQSALWCAESVDLLWENRSQFISEKERPEARAAYDRALAIYKTRAAEAGE